MVDGYLANVTSAEKYNFALSSPLLSIVSYS